jgi:PPM family protein phosphatase
MFSTEIVSRPQLPAPPPTLDGVGGGLSWHAVTHCGLVRSQNEDAFCVEHSEANGPQPRFMSAIADGLGGHQSGEVASRLALEAVKAEFNAWTGGSPERLVARAVRHANDEVFAAANSRTECNNMQTTLTIAVTEGETMAVGHVGDCRLYRKRGSHAELLTRDHTLAMDLLQLHLISHEEASEHPGRYQLTRAVGGEPFLRIDTYKEHVIRGDTFLLCSDGLWSQVPQEEIERLMALSDLSMGCDGLLGVALAEGAPDNVTAILFRTNSSLSTAPPPKPFWQGILSRKKISIC